MIRRPPRSTLSSSSAASDVYKRQANVPQAWRNRLRDLADRAIGFAREVAGHTDNEAEARRATSLLYHVASAVALAWEGGRIHLSLIHISEPTRLGMISYAV